MPLRVVTDSTSDLSPELARQFDITVVPVYVRFGAQTYRDGVDISHDEFYRKLTGGDVHPSTSQPTPTDFADVYRTLARETDEIVSVHVSSKLSGTQEAALLGREMAGLSSRINVIDSQSVSMGLGMMALEAAREAQTGGGLTEAVARVRRAVANTRLLAIFDTLRYLVLGGRIGKAKGLVGSVLNVKPVLTMRDGEMHPAGFARTRARGIDRLIEFVRNAANIEELALVHSTTPDEAGFLGQKLGSFVDGNRIHVARLGPSLGVHGGPGTLGVVYRRNPAPLPAKPVKRKITVPALHLRRTPEPQPGIQRG
jgi:DegV family protein with EDD domain